MSRFHWMRNCFRIGTSNSIPGIQKRAIHHPYFENMATGRDENLKIGIIGAGKNTKELHIQNLQKIPGVKITAVCNRTIESGQIVAKEFNIPKVCKHFMEIMEDTQIDAVVIGTWPNMHKALTVAALNHNKHVLCEARMAMNALEAHEMLETLKLRSYLVAQIVPSPYTLQFDKTIQNLIKQNYLGELIHIDLKYVNPSFVDFTSDLTWRQDSEKSGLNILSMGIWYEALMRWVGPATSVMAMGKVVVKQRRNPETNSIAAVTVPEHLDILAEMACGAQARMQFSSVVGLSSPKSEVWLFGTEGTLKLDVQKKQLLGGKKGDTALEVIEIPEQDQGHWRVEEEFINSIRGKEEVKLTTFESGVKYMEFTEAVNRSFREKKAITLPLPSM